MDHWISIAAFSWTRVFLFAGMILHKAVWEVLKKRGAKEKSRQPRSVLVRILKLAKVLFLLGILAQTLFLNVFLIADCPPAVRIAGWLLYSAGLLIAITGRLHLGESWADVEDAQILQKQKVVATGIYRYIRHPIYFGDLLLIAGLELALQSWLFLGALLLAFIVRRQAMSEEKLLATAFPGYAEYCARTKRFIPFVY